MLLRKPVSNSWWRLLIPIVQGQGVNKRRVNLVVYDLAIGTYYNILCTDLQERYTSLAF